MRLDLDLVIEAIQELREESLNNAFQTLKMAQSLPPDHQETALSLIGKALEKSEKWAQHLKTVQQAKKDLTSGKHH